MTLNRIVFLFILLPWVSTAAPIFPPLISGEASVTILTPPIELGPDGVTLRPPIKSVALLKGINVVLCEPMGNGESKRVTFLLANNALGRVDVFAQSYPNVDCTGTPSEPSINTAYYFFVGPLPADLEP